MEPQWRYLAEGSSTLGSEILAKMKTKFEASNFSRRVTLRKAFYGAEHDPSQPIEIFIQSVLKAKAALTAIQVEVDDVAAKDVILMNLHPSYSGVKTSLLTQPNEPSLESIRSILSTTTSFVDPEIQPTTTVKAEPGETALATKFNKSNARYKSSGSSRSGEYSSDHRKRSADRENSGGGGVKDSKGHIWCNPDNDYHCHRCGATGHRAWECVKEMPPEVKDWLRSQSEERNEHSMWVYSRMPSRSRSPPTHHSNSPSPRRVSFHTRSHSGSRSPSPTHSTYPADYDSDDDNSS